MNSMVHRYLEVTALNNFNSNLRGFTDSYTYIEHVPDTNYLVSVHNNDPKEVVFEVFDVKSKPTSVYTSKLIKGRINKIAT